MKDREGRLETFRDSVMAQAREERDKILEEGRRETRRILSRAEEEADREADFIVKRAQQQADKVVDTAQAESELDAQALKLRRRETLLQDVYERAKEQLQSAPGAGDYSDVIERLVREAVDQMEEIQKLVVHGDDTAMDILRDGLIGGLSADLGLSLTLGDPLEHDMGVIVETVDKHRRYNNTLSERLDRQWEALRDPVYRTLRGDNE